MLKADGFDDCVIGLSRVAGQEDKIVYDYNKCIEKLMKDGMDYDEALEYMEYNVVSAYVGEGTPAFFVPRSLEDIEIFNMTETLEINKEDRSMFRCDGCDNYASCFLQVPIEEAELPTECPYKQGGSTPSWEKTETLRDRAWWDGGNK